MKAATTAPHIGDTDLSELSILETGGFSKNALNPVDYQYSIVHYNIAFYPFGVNMFFCLQVQLGCAKKANEDCGCSISPALSLISLLPKHEALNPK